MLLFFRLLLLVLTLTPAVALGAEGDWQVARATQQVNVTTDEQNWKPVKAGDVIPNRAWISTGPKGRVQLTRGMESLSFQPNTMAGVFTSGVFERKTEVLQKTGSIDLEIEKRSRPHTTVETPFLAAVVKGTNFRVSVTKTTATVSVNRGLVQVTSFASGQRSNVGPGQSASVDSAKGMTVAGVSSTPAIAAVAPSVARVSAIGTTELSGQPSTNGTTATSTPSSSSSTSPTGTSAGNAATGPSNSGGSPGGTQSGGAGRSDKPSKSVERGEPAKGQDIGKPEDPTKPSKPDQPSKPERPGKPDKPGKPDDPGKPGKPEGPGKPEKPGKPDDVGKPDDPGKPSKPDKPGSPESPSKPDKPGKPDDPGQPEKPGKPDKPDGPEKPEDTPKPGKANDPGKPGKPSHGGKDNSR